VVDGAGPSVAAATTSGTAASRKPLAELTLRDETRDLLQRSLFVEPGLSADMARNAGALKSADMFVPSAVDNRSPRNHFIKALQEIPVAPTVKAHSIVAVIGDGPVANGDDGVVRYSSAHISGVESELVVRSEHSTQGRPETIEEVRRILRLHADVK
jgi:hypothetical protein